jgi:hypothetical protein
MPWMYDFPMPKNADGRCYYCDDTGISSTWTSNMHKPVVSSTCLCPVGDRIREIEAERDAPREGAARGPAKPAAPDAV